MRASVLAASRAIARSTGGVAISSLLVGAILLGVPVQAQDEPLGRVTPDPTNDGAPFAVDQILLEYAWNRDGEPFAENPGLPGIESLYDTTVRLLQTDEGFVATRQNLPSVTLTLAEINAMSEQVMYRSAVVAVMESIRNRLNREGVIGVFAYPTDLVLQNAGSDGRTGGDTSMQVRVLIGWVDEVRTIGGGGRFGEEAVRNVDSHNRIRSNSPVTPATQDERNVLDRGALDDYVLRLNRHPGRVVNLGVGTGSGQGSVVVDYHIFEAKPWYAYFQLSNTGTEETNEWRERLGFVHNQLTSNDDILTLDFVTASLDESNALVASYEAPFGGREDLRWRAQGSVNEFTGSDIGDQSENDVEGDGWSLGGDLVWNVHQDRELFVDVVGGLRYQEVTFENSSVDTSGDGSFWLPHIGVSLDRLTEISSFVAGADFEIGVASEDSSELERLGRSNVDSEWVLFHYNLEWSFFLEPVLFRDQFLDLDATWNSQKTLAHEIAFELRGQEAFGSRLVPNFQAVTGGAATVRGYPESEVPSDSVTVFSTEYRFHVPRAFEPGDPGTFLGQPFKTRPQRTWGRPDWDLVLKGFLDIGRVVNNDGLSFEPDETLVGAGLGAEFVFRRNVVMSIDWGVALEDTENVESGDSEVHFILTLLY